MNIVFFGSSNFSVPSLKSISSHVSYVITKKGKPKGPMSEEEKLKRSITMTGQKKTKSHGANVAKANIGNISINQDDVEKKVKKDVLQSYLDQGWQLGGKKRKLA